MTICCKRGNARYLSPLAALLLTLPSLAYAFSWSDGFDRRTQTVDRYGLLFSPFTQHFHPSSEHEDVWLLGLERERSSSQLAGVALFSNSFGQPSAYFYPWGKIYRDVLGRPELFVKVTAGVLYGYRGQYQDKVPFNHEGFSPAVVPAVGWDCRGRYQVQANLLGLNALMLQFTVGLR